VEHDDAPQTTVRALFNDIKTARLGVAVGINNIPGIAVIPSNSSKPLVLTIRPPGTA